MQPFDALTMKAVLQEARPLLLNRKVEKVYQLGRDEVIIAFRSKAGTGYFLLSAQASFGRLCLVNMPPLPKAVNPPAFCQLLRKHLTGATLMAVDQIPGERVADLTFACVDELGNRTTKVLTAEIMGRHSNLIFWDKETEKILGASHVVTQEMSRQREVAPGLKYIRPPHQERTSIFELKEEQFAAQFETLKANNAAAAGAAQAADAPPPPANFEHWLLTTFAGLGRHLSEEVISTSGAPSEISEPNLSDDTREKIWQGITKLQGTSAYRSSLKTDLTRYSVLSWWEETDPESDEWKKFPTANDMVEDYFRTLQTREQMQQLKDRIRSELRSETEKLESRISNAQKQLEIAKDMDQLKVSGDMILANINNISAGQTELNCENLYEANAGTDNGSNVAITLNPNLSASQNAQHYYRQFAKARVRQKTASAAHSDAATRLEAIKKQMEELEQAKAPEELERLKELILDRGRKHDQRHGQKPQQGGGGGGKPQPGQKRDQPRLMSIRSSDGHIIYVGRNRQENDILIVKLAQPHDIWMHVQGQEGAHVLIKVPNKQDPPATTLKEAGQLAARFSRVTLGAKVRVVYTHCKYVRKIAKDKPGLVRYENEKTLEVDTAAPMPPSLRKLFNK